MNKIFNNLLKAIGIIIYFIILNFAYTKINLDRLIEVIKVCSGAFLVLSLVMLEKAYKEDSGKTAITGIELLILSLHSLSIMHIINLFQYDFRIYLTTSSFVIAIYYVLKAVVVYTKDRREYLEGLSDISEIVKEEPLIKEAKKRKKEELNNKEKAKTKTKRPNNKKTAKDKKEENNNSKKKEVKPKTKKASRIEKPNNETEREVERQAEKSAKKGTKTQGKTKKRSSKTKKEVKEND